MSSASGERRFDIAVVGVTGIIGEHLLDLLKDREFPVGKVHALDVEAVAGGTVKFGNRDLPVDDLGTFDFSRVQLALFAAGSAVAAAFVAKATAAGCLVVDSSPQFRLEADVPLVIPEVNPEALAGVRARGIVASPNCSTTLMLMALKPIHDAVGIARINVCTYQSVSGSGRDAIEELGRQTAALLNFKDVEVKVYPKQIAFNVLPQVDVIDDSGCTREEQAMLRETRKILGDASIGVNVTAVRVPVFYGHSAALHIETRKKISADEARELLENTAGIVVIDRHEDGGYPTAVSDASGEDAVFVGRIRDDISHPTGLNLWVVGDNIRKGMALNAVQIAEQLIRSYL